MAWIALALRRLRDERPSSIGFALLVLVTAFIGSAAPRLVDMTADTTLRAELGALRPAAVNVQLVRLDVVAPAPDGGTGTVDAEEAQAFAQLPPGLQAVVPERGIVIEGPRWSVAHAPKGPTTVRIRIQPGAETRLHLVAGVMPTTVTHPGATADDPVAIEVALPVASAHILDVGIGDRVDLALDRSDAVAPRTQSARAAIVVTGLYEVDDPTARWWLGDPALAGPIVRSLGGDAQVMDLTAFVPPASYGTMLALQPPGTLGPANDPVAAGKIARFTYRAYVDLARLDERDLQTLLPELRALETRLPGSTVPSGAGYALRTGLRAALEAHVARWASASALLTVAATGPIAVAVGALGLVAVLAARRRRSALALARGRGASLRQVIVAVAAEGLLLAVPTAVAALTAALVLLPGPPSPPAVLAASAVVTAALVILLLGTVPATGGPAFGAGREARVPRAPSGRRLLFEGILVVAAVAGAMLLRERGVRAGTVTGAPAAVDPLVAAVPALVGIAAGILAVRLLPIPVAAAARLARSTRGLVAMLALRRASGDGSMPIVLVLLGAAAISAFSASAVTYLDRSAEAAGWRDVGADARIVADQSSIRIGFDPTGVPGVTAAAGMFRGPASVVQAGAATDLAAIDVSAYERVVEGTPAAGTLPLDFFGPAVEPIPVIASARLMARPDAPKRDQTFGISVQGYTFRARIVEVRDAFPGLADAPLFLIVPRDMVRSLFSGAPLTPTMMFVRADPTAIPGLRDAVAAGSPGATVESRVERTAEIREAPIAVAVRAGILAAAIVAGLYAALAVAAGLALAGASRAIEVAHLRTLGLSDGQASRLLVAEHAPTVALASVAGFGLGLGLFAALLPGLGLDAFAGADLAVPSGIDPALAGLIAAGLLGVVLAGLGLGILLERRMAPAAALRRGFE